jgi:hypothetical protein
MKRKPAKGGYCTTSKDYPCNKSNSFRGPTI